MNQDIRHARHERGAGDGENPRRYDSLAPDPSDGADATHGSHAQDRSGDGMGG